MFECSTSHRGLLDRRAGSRSTTRVSDPAARAGPRAIADFLRRLRQRGVLRAAASYAVIVWLALQIADVILDPLGLPRWVMTALIIAAAAGFPVAIALAWFLEIGEHGVTVDTAAEGMPRPTTRGLRHYADALVIGVLLVTVVILAARQSDLGRPKPPENPAIAVLPFENLSGDPEQDYFSDGLAEEMLDRLGRVPGLKVIARSSSFEFRGRDVDARKVAEVLGVTNVLEGSVRRAGKRLKLTARLVDGATGQQVWSGSFDRETADVFEVQAELAGGIVEAIIPAARGAVPDAAPPTRDLSAYDLYLLARSQAAVRTGAALEKSVELMDRALKIDSDFALAHAHRAESLLLLRAYGESTAEQSAAMLREAEASAHRALAVDPDLSDAHQVYAMVLRESDRPGAEGEYKRALELNPNNAAALHFYANYLTTAGGPTAESDRMTERALQLDPRQPVYWANYLGQTLDPGGRRFRETVDRAIQAVGDMPDALWQIGIGTAQFGYPVETMKIAIAKERLRSDEVTKAWIFSSRAWLPVDPDRSAAELPDQGSIAAGDFLAQVRLFAEVEAAGRKGDWSRLDADFVALRELLGEENPGVRSTMAFWLAVQGRYEEAAASLAQAEPLEEVAMPLRLGGDTLVGLLESAKLRILRGTGRNREADRLAGTLLNGLRAGRKAADEDCRWQSWMQYAGIAASEGFKDEAVDALQAAMKCSDLPFGFLPQLPWFESLAGHSGYDALALERSRRIDAIRQELQRLESRGN